MPSLNKNQLTTFAEGEEKRWILRLYNSIKKLYPHNIGHLSDEELHGKVVEVFNYAKELGFHTTENISMYVRFCVGIFPDHHLDPEFNNYLLEKPEQVEARFLAVMNATKFEIKLQLEQLGKKP